MKKQKLAVCVLSAALMIGAATLTSYAAEGWQQSGNSWIYVDNNGNKVTNTWKKGADNLWRYLDSRATSRRTAGWTTNTLSRVPASWRLTSG